MKFYFNIFWIIFIFSTYKIQPAVQAITKSSDSFNSLFQERIENLVIFNDLEEKAWQSNIPLFETKKYNEGTIFGVFTFSLMSSLVESQTIFCSKFLFKNYIFLSQIWPDLLYLNVKSFQYKYKNRVDNLSEQELELIMKTAQQIDLLLSDDLDKDKETKILKLLSQLPIYERSLYITFLFYKGYERFKKEDKYNIYEINEYFLLFFPKEKISKASLIFNKNKDKSLFYMFKNFNQFCEIYFGFNIPLLNPFAYSESNFSVDIPKDVKYYFIGEYLIDGLQKLFVNNFLWKMHREKESLPAYLLPRFNIVLGGHGSLDLYLMELKPQQIKRILSFLNNHVWTKTLMLESCYIGGANFKNIFGHGYEILHQFTQNLNYTILFEGTFYGITKFFAIYTDWVNYNKDIEGSFYSTVFDALSLGKANYLKIIEKLNSLLLPEDRISNYISIKYPNIGWITANDYGKDVFDITKVRIAEVYPDYVIKVPDSKNIVLMSTNVMPLHIDLNMAHRQNNNKCQFLPVFYTDLNYAIDTLRLLNIVITPVDREKQIAEIVYNLFNLKISSLSEPITVFIKAVHIGRYKIDNVLIHLKNKQILFESINRPGMLVLGEDKEDGFSVKKIEPFKGYTAQVDKMKKKLDFSIDSDGFLAGMSNEFIKKLKVNIEAKNLSKLSVGAKPFISKIQPIKL